QGFGVKEPPSAHESVPRRLGSPLILKALRCVSGTDRNTSLVRRFGGTDVDGSGRPGLEMENRRRAKQLGGTKLNPAQGTAAKRWRKMQEIPLPCSSGAPSRMTRLRSIREGSSGTPTVTRSPTPLPITIPT